MKLKVGQPAPDFTLPSHLGKPVSLGDLRGRNVVLAFYPLAWTPIWTSQIPSYEAEKALFAGLNAQVLGISVDHIPCLKAWANSLGGISYPLLSDFWPHGRVSECYDVLRSDGTSERAIFVIDREGIIQYIDVHDIDSQPSNMELREVLRRVDPEAAEQAPEEEDFDLPLAHGGIVMYCTPWCSDCKQAREWLIANKLPFTEVDISRNLKAAAQVRSWADGHETTPTFEINGTIVVEFQREKLAELLLK